MNVSAQNLEDAANLATEFIYSLENLPNEVRHLLEEIRHKESRAQELQQQIDSDSARWIRHTLRGSAVVLGSSPSPSPSPSSKSVAHLPPKIKQSYAEIEQLSTDKIELAQRIVELISRTCARLDVDLNRVRVLQGETLLSEPYNGRGVSASPSLASVSGTGLTGRDPASALSDSLRLALTSGTPAESRPVANAVAAVAAVPTPPTKKRRLTSSPSIKLPPASRSISPAAPATKTTSHRGSRLQRQVYPPPPAEVEPAEEEEDAEGEGEGEGDGDEDDQRLYCFCQKPSAGEMIACDNAACPYEWFHLECIGLKEPPPDNLKWYCPLCKDKMGARRGRKKS